MSTIQEIAFSELPQKIEKRYIYIDFCFSNNIEIKNGKRFMSINIRKATSDDASFLAQMILQSTRADKKIGVYDLIFKTTNDEQILDNLKKLTNTTAKNSCHYTNFLRKNFSFCF